jgi:hypothetical protein
MTQAADIKQLKAQVADLTAAVAAFLQGNLDGDGSAKGWLLAVDPKLQIEPAAFEFGEQ